MAAEAYDVIVIGGGLLGASVGAALAEARKTVLVLEARAKGHSEGSSHGHSRIVRTLGSETPVFAETARYGLEAMRALEASPGAIVRQTPAVFIANRNSKAYRDLAREDSSATHRPDVLTPMEVAKYGLKIKDDQVGILDPDSGVLDPTALLEVLYGIITRNGQTVVFEAPAVVWEISAAGVSVRMQNGETFRGGQLVIAAGGWLPEVLSRGNVNAEVIRRLGGMRLERIPLFYFDYPRAMEDVIPVTVSDTGDPDMYAMPEYRGQPVREVATRSEDVRYLKVGFHKGTQVIRPADVCRAVQHLEELYAKNYMEGLLGRRLTLRETSVCLYAMAPDSELPLIGPLPGTPDVHLAAYGGGICAKHAIALGNALSCTLQGRESPWDLTAFDPNRLMTK